jgi:hypothetical protein
LKFESLEKLWDFKMKVFLKRLVLIKGIISGVCGAAVAQ